MKLLFTLVVLASFLTVCSRQPNAPVQTPEHGSAAVTVTIGKVGTLGKVKDIELSNLYITLTMPGEETIYDTFNLGGNGSAIYQCTYGNLVSLLKTWTLHAETRDTEGEVIHSGSTQFIVPADETIPVSLVLGARYSMLKASFFPVLDSVTRCELAVNGTTVDQTSFEVQSRVGDTVTLAYDYLTTGSYHTVTMNVYGDMWGFDTLLYTGETMVFPQSGSDENLSIILEWVGPGVPPPGQAAMTVTIGMPGTIVINGELENNDAYLTIEGMTIDTNVADEVYSWYDGIYLPTLMGYPGIRESRRYHMFGGFNIDALPVDWTLFLFATEDEQSGFSGSTQAAAASASMAAQWTNDEIAIPWVACYEKIKSWDNPGADGNLLYCTVVSTVSPPEVEEAVNRWECEVHIPWVMRYTGIARVVRYRKIDGAGNGTEDLPKYIETFYYYDLESMNGLGESEHFITAEEDRVATWDESELSIGWVISGEGTTFLTR